MGRFGSDIFHYFRRLIRSIVRIQYPRRTCRQLLSVCPTNAHQYQLLSLHGLHGSLCWLTHHVNNAMPLRRRLHPHVGESWAHSRTVHICIHNTRAQPFAWDSANPLSNCLPIPYASIIYCVLSIQCVWLYAILYSSMCVLSLIANSMPFILADARCDSLRLPLARC